MKALVEYIMENTETSSAITTKVRKGHKQRVTDAGKFKKEAIDKCGFKTPEYYKFMTDFLVEELLWKYPEISYRDTETIDYKMGYNKNSPAKIHAIEYTYKNHVLGFKFNDFFSEPFCDFYIDGKNINDDITGSFGDVVFISFLCNKNLIGKYKSIIDKL
jgi:hypothetical protein